jgi:hypothetical protein
LTERNAEPLQNDYSARTTTTPAVVTRLGSR